MRTLKHLAIIGAGGVLGSKLIERALADSDAHITAFAHSCIPLRAVKTQNRVTWKTLNIGDAEAVQHALIQAQSTVVINAAAMTDVDACESQRTEALMANSNGPGNLATACVASGAHLLHVSTDYVFPGTSAHPGPYFEGARMEPINWYGETKLRGEQAIMQICTQRVPWLIARTALVYGYVPGGRTNFITWLVNELRVGHRVKVVNDQFNTPTLVDDLAAALLHMAKQASVGIYHLAGSDLLSREAWAHEIAAHYKLDQSLIDITTTANLQQPAPRPLYSGLRSLHGNELGSVTLRGVRAGLQALQVSY
jgi:dTDP-4-dehydrorhamnose reductase